MILTEENYYSTKANLHYMSASQYKDFLKCEALALAKLRGEFNEFKQEALTLGSYVHAAIESPEAFEKFKNDTPDIYTAKKELKAPYKHADVMIESVLSDELCNMVLQGDKEVILTAELFGAPWKSKIDVLAREFGRFTDLKTVKSIRDRYWDGSKYVSFVEIYKYDVQMAIYSEIEKRSSKSFERLEPLIVAVSKEDIPDKEIICFDEANLEQKLMEIEQSMPRIIQVKNGQVDPVRCGKCTYCRKTKQVQSMTHYLDLLEGA